MLLLTSALAVVSVLGMDIDVSGLMQGLGTKPALLLRGPVWQQVVFIPRQLRIPFRGGFHGFARALFQVLVPVWQLLFGFDPQGASQWPLPFQLGACHKTGSVWEPSQGWTSSQASPAINPQAALPCYSPRLVPVCHPAPCCSLSPGLSQGLRAVTRLCGEATKCIFHKAHGSWWISRAAGGVLHVAAVGAPLCQVLCRECRGFLGLKIPLGILQAELGLAGGSWLGDRAQGGMVVLGRQSGVSAAVGVVCWIHHCWISVTLSRNSAWFLNLLIEFLYREAGM